MAKSHDISLPLESGNWYHLYNRGNNKQTIFFEERNYYYFLERFRMLTSDVLETHCYCLLPNHFHFVVRARKEGDILQFFLNNYPVYPKSLKNKLIARFNSISRNISTNTRQMFNEISALPTTKHILVLRSICCWMVSEQLRRVFLGYTKAVNRQQGREGSLMQKNFRRKQIDSATYLIYLMKYIHRNPNKHGVHEKWQNYPYSSYLDLTTTYKSWLEKEACWKQFGGRQAFIQFQHSTDIYLPGFKYTVLEE